MTEWKPSRILPAYEVSNTGRVRRLLPGHGARVGHEPKGIVTEGGYHQLCLGGNARHQVHRLVAHEFCKHPDAPDFYADRNWVVNHLNTDRLDNRAGNLEWVTIKQNNNHCGRCHELDLIAEGEYF